MVNAVRLACVLSNDATPITSRPTAGADAPYNPASPSFPIDATTTIPWRTRRSEALAVGYSGHWNEDPMLMFKTSAPSASVISMAASMMSEVVDPSQPKTR